MFAGGSTCVLQGQLPETCEPGGCCPVGKHGLAPIALHGKLVPAGFVLRVDFASNGSDAASWSLRAGVPGGKCDGGGCATKVVGQGTVQWAVGEWMRLGIAARRLGGATDNRTMVRCTLGTVGERPCERALAMNQKGGVGPGNVLDFGSFSTRVPQPETQHGACAQGTKRNWIGRRSLIIARPFLLLQASHTFEVDTLPEARGAAAFGSGFTLPFSQWDNLTVAPAVAVD